MPLDPAFHAKAMRQANKPAGRKATATRLAALAEGKTIARVRVEPTDEKFRGVLRHPGGMGFRTAGSVEWPYDSFTVRRINDGSIKIVEEIGLDDGVAALRQLGLIKAA